MGAQDTMIRLSDETYEYIKNEVIHLITLYDIKCMPISAFELASKMNIAVIPYSCLTEQTRKLFLKISQDGFSYNNYIRLQESIYYNDEVSYDRRNMTILHEIGHIALGHKINLESNEIECLKSETEAKFFAKYAAAPPPLVHKLRPKCPEDIEEAFNISFEAACYAYNYYCKWLIQFNRKGGYKDYENKLLCHASKG